MSDLEEKRIPICNVLFGEFKELFGLELSERCPGCTNKGVYHNRSEPIISTGITKNESTYKAGLSNVTNAFIKIQKLLPDFDKTDCREFLKKVERRLRFSDGIPQDKWTLVFMYITMDSSGAAWIERNIINEELDWNDAKNKFISHFQRADHRVQLRHKYDNIKQTSKESVQDYSDRFIDICEELNRPDNDPIVIDHYVKHLQSEIQKKFRERLTTVRIDKDDLDFEFTSLKKVINICIAYDIQDASSGNYYSKNSSDINTKSEKKLSNGSSTGTGKYCSIHPNGTHDESECRRTKKASTPLIQPSSSRDVSTVQCFKCFEFGHYANDCPNPKKQEAGNEVAIVREKREIKPPVKLTYDKPGTPNDVAGKTVSLQGGNQLVQSSRIYLIDAARDQKFRGLVDTGADTSFIDKSLVKELGLKVNVVDGKISFASNQFNCLREGKTEPLLLTAVMPLGSGSNFQSTQIHHSFEVMELDASKYEFIIGTDLLAVIFPNNIPVSYYSSGVKPNDVSVCRATIINDLVENFNSSSVDSVQLLDEIVGHGAVPVEEVKERASVSTSSSLEEEYSQLREQIMNDPLVVEQVQINELLSGFCNLHESIVHLPVADSFEQTGYRKQYGVPQAAHEAVTQQVEKWFVAGKIALAPANCPFNSSLTIATKKDAFGTFTGYRICLDTRALNASITRADRFQLPYIRDVLEKFRGCLYFGEIDLSEAYLQFQLDEESQQLTAFTWNGRQYMFVGCPFGISLLPSYFQRVMCNIFNDLPFTCPYLDNLPFGSATVEEHRKQLILILQRCNKYNLKVKLSALKVCHSEMRCLGHLLTHEGVALSPSKLEFISKYVRPTTGKQLQSFLGVVTFLRPNVRHMSELTASLESVKNTVGEIEWTDQMIGDYEIVKQAIASAPKLAYPDFNKPFHIATDASNVGVGGVLYQPDEYGGDITADNIVAVVSKKLSGSQLNYPAYKKELLAIVYCLRQFHSYVWGQFGVIVFTDHKPLTHLFEQRELSPAVQQWLDVLLDYQFELYYREGKLNILPDHLSRLYAGEYDGSSAWGVPKVMPWKIQPSIATGNVIQSGSDSTITVNVVVIEEVVDEKTESFFSNSSVDGGENAEALIVSNDKLVESVLELERRGYSIPESEERQELIKQEHLFGHFGINAICSALIKRKVWWKGMRKDVADELGNCDPCTRYTVIRSGFNPAGYIIASTPWEHIQVDTSVHLPHAPGGFKCLLVIIDVFTGFVILRPMTSSSAEIVANELWNVFCILGLPKIIQSDNGPEFVNEVIRALVKLTGIEHRFISPYNPRADGKVERSIQTVMSIIKKLLHGNEKNWHLFVPFAQLSFNNKITSLTGSSAFSLMFGRSLNPIKDYTGNDENGIEIKIDDLNTWKSHMEKIQSLIYPAILERTKKSKDAMIVALDKKRRVLTKEHILHPGAVVMLRDPHRKDKFEPKYIGPYSVVRRSRNGNYSLKDMTNEPLDRYVPIDQLKVISKKPRPQDNETEYDIERIIKHRGQSGTYEYFTKFKNYRVPDWIPEGNFADTALIRDYWNSVSQSTNSE